MEIEKTLVVAAPPSRLWQLLLDPQVMASCVPGMQSVEVVSPTEYHALMHVKIAFVSARFRLRTTVVEQHAPHYLRAEGTGEDASVASSLKQQTEMVLAELPEGRTELKIKVKVDVLGKLGSFGLSAMKTKADRMWDEFGMNLGRQLDAAEPATVATARMTAARDRIPGEAAAATPRQLEAVVVDAPALRPAEAGGWWPRLLAGLSQRSARPQERCIRIELKRDDASITVHWPLEASAECAALLRDCLRQ